MGYAVLNVESVLLFIQIYYPANPLDNPSILL